MGLLIPPRRDASPRALAWGLSGNPDVSGLALGRGELGAGRVELVVPLRAGWGRGRGMFWSRRAGPV